MNGAFALPGTLVKYTVKPHGGQRRFRWGRNSGCYVTKIAPLQALKLTVSGKLTFRGRVVAFRMVPHLANRQKSRDRLPLLIPHPGRLTLIPNRARCDITSVKSNYQTSELPTTSEISTELHTNTARTSKNVCAVSPVPVANITF